MFKAGADFIFLNRSVPSDRDEIVSALKQATEVVTSLSSVDFYDSGSAAKLIAAGLKESTAKGTNIYSSLRLC